MLTFRDPRGRVLFHLDKDDGVPRDEAGKPIAHRAGKDDQLTKLSVFAARRMAPALLDLSPGDVMNPSTRADFGIPSAYRDFVADVVSPVTFVKKDRGYYFTENVADGLEIVQAQANLVGQQAEVSPGFASAAFNTTGYALATKVSARLLSNADFDLRLRVVRYLVDVLRRAREDRVATQLSTSTNFAVGNRVAAVSSWNGAAATTPAIITDVFAALLASYLPADTLVLPENVAPWFHYAAAPGAVLPAGGNPAIQVRDFVQGGGQLPRILYARGKKSFNKKPAYIWMPSGAGSIAVVRTTTHDESWQHWHDTHGKKESAPYDIPPWFEPNDAITDIGTSHTLRWADGADGLRLGGVLVREYDDEKDVDTKWICVAVNDAEIVPSNQVGAIITGAMT